ncbi:hypothetical protein HMI56_003730, partial [Coelomomyces lativittatus]
MESQIPKKRILRQGWIFKRGHFYRPWRLKWCVITEGDTQMKPILGIFNQREHAYSMAPKLQIPITMIELEVPVSLVKRHLLDRVGLAPLVIVQNQRK